MSKGECSKCFQSRTQRGKAEHDLAECSDSLSAARKAISDIVAAGAEEKRRRDLIEDILRNRISDLEKEIEYYKPGSY